MQTMDEFLRCLLLPLENISLLLPYAAVGEVISCDTLKTVPKMPNWILGTCTWRELELTVLDFEKMGDLQVSDPVFPNSHDSSPAKSSDTFRLAVINRSQETAPYKFIGIKLSRIPKMNRYKKSDLKMLKAFTGESLLMETEARGQKAAIPNLPWMEDKLRGLKIPH